MSSYSKNTLKLEPLKFDSLDFLDIVRVGLVVLLLAIALFSAIGIIAVNEIAFGVWGVVFICYLYTTYNKVKSTDNKFLYGLYHTIFLVAAIVVAIVAFYPTNNLKAWFLVEQAITLLMVMMFVFITLPKKTLVFLYRYALKYKFFNVSNSDFFTSSLDYDMAIDSKKIDDNGDTIFIINTKVNQKKDIKDDKFNSIKQYYAKLIYFWYATKFEKVLLRFILPLWSVIFGILFFVIILAILDNIDNVEQVNIIRMSFVVLFLTILFMSMIYQINNTLDARGYMQHINRGFKNANINFGDIKPSQRVLLFFDRTFMVYIYDTKFDRRVLLNNSKSFERFILKADLDKEGRDNIASIFVTLFIVVYIEIFAQVLSDSKTDMTIKDINKTVVEIKKNLENLGDKNGEEFNKK